VIEEARMSDRMHHNVVQLPSTIAGVEADGGPGTAEGDGYGVAFTGSPREDRTEIVRNGIRAYESTFSIVALLLFLTWGAGIAAAVIYGLMTADVETAGGYGLAAAFLGFFGVGLGAIVAKFCLSPWAFALRLRSRRLIDQLLPHPGLCRRWLWDEPWPNAIAVAVPERRLLITGHLSAYEVISIPADRIIDVELRTRTEREIVTKHSGTSIIAPTSFFAFSTGSTSRSKETQRDYAWLDIRYTSPTSYEPIRLTVPFGEDVSAAGDIRAAIQIMRFG
jgi:hypothetical protein